MMLFLQRRHCLHTTVTCKLSLRISELVPVRQDTELRNENPANDTARTPQCNLQNVSNWALN
jgi:hypothetical protein